MAAYADPPDGRLQGVPVRLLLPTCQQVTAMGMVSSFVTGE